MQTTLSLDDILIQEAKRLGKHQTVDEAVTAALEEYINFRKRTEVLELFGTIEFDDVYDYKAARFRDHH